VVYFKKAVEDEIIRRLDKAVQVVSDPSIINKIDVIESLCKSMTSENIVINRRDV
jgi:hypothetical protein